MKTIAEVTKMSLCALALSLTFNGNAQVSMGFKGGTNLGSLKVGEEVEGFTMNNNIGTTFGMNFEFRFNKVFALQPEFNYIQKGVVMKNEQTYTDGDAWAKGEYTVRMKFNYIEFPMMLKVGYNTDKMGINLLAGPGIGFCVNNNLLMEEKFSDSYGNNEVETTEDEMKMGFSEGNDLNVIDISANVGLEACVKLGPGKLYAEGRYQAGLKDISFGENIKHVGIQAVLGYRIPLSGPKQNAKPVKS